MAFKVDEHGLKSMKSNEIHEFCHVFAMFRPQNASKSADVAHFSTVDLRFSSES